MSGGWRALRESLVRSVRTLAAHRQFADLRPQAAALLRFNDPVGLIDDLTQGDGDLDEKDRVYACLVQAAQAAGPAAPLASTLLLLGLWPGLDGIYQRRVGKFGDEPAETAEIILTMFSDVVRRLRLGMVNRVAATLVWNTERRVVDVRVNEAASESRRTDAPDDETPAPSDGAVEALDDESQKQAIRARLTSILGERDADLLIATLVGGETQRSFARRQGLSEGMVRKSHQRAVKKLRRRCPTSESWTAFTRRRARVPPGDEP